MNWNSEEIRALVPEERIKEILGFDPQLRLSLDEDVKGEDLGGYRGLSVMLSLPPLP